MTQSKVRIEFDKDSAGKEIKQKFMEVNRKAVVSEGVVSRIAMEVVACAFVSFVAWVCCYVAVFILDMMSPQFSETSVASFISRLWIIMPFAFVGRGIYFIGYLKKFCDTLKEWENQTDFMQFASAVRQYKYFNYGGGFQDMYRIHLAPYVERYEKMLKLSESTIVHCAKTEERNLCVIGADENGDVFKEFLPVDDLIENINTSEFLISWDNGRIRAKIPSIWKKAE